MSKDEWETPQDLLDALGEEFKFIIDACATQANQKCYFRLSNALEPWIDQKLIDYRGKQFPLRVWPNGAVFMNPPFSSPKPFLEQAWEFSMHMPVVCLVPNTIITAQYMDFLFDSDHYYRVPKDGLEIRYLPRRTKFTHPNKKASSPAFGCMLLIMDRRDLEIDEDIELMQIFNPRYGE